MRKCAVKGCDQKPGPGNSICILHRPMPKDGDEFVRVLNGRIQEGKFDCSGFVFPVPVVSPAADWPDRGSAVVVLPDPIPYGFSFDNAVFCASVTIEYATFEGWAEFNGAEFRDSAVFTGTVFGQFCHFNRCSFLSFTSFANCHFPEGGAFAGCLFSGDDPCDEEETAFFDNATFENGFACFGGSRFEVEGSFYCCRFDQAIELAGVRFERGANFAYCKASDVVVGYRRPTTLPLVVQRRGVSFGSSESEQCFWRFARRVYEDQGDRARADAAFYFERVAEVSPRGVQEDLEYEELTNQRRTPPILAALRIALAWARWSADCLLLRWPTAYGVGLARLGFTWVGVVVLFALLYRTLGVLSESVTLGGAFYFSISTFTTLGYGDIRPLPGLGSALSSTEALLGGVTMALTVLVIGRRFMR